MGGLFSKVFGGSQAEHSKQDNAIDAHDKAVYDLKIQRDRLTKYIENSHDIIEREKSIAKQLLRQGKKERAKLVLQKKRYQENLIERTRAKLENIEELVNSVEFGRMQAEVFAALSEGKNALEAINAEISIEDVEQLMEDTEEAIRYQDEISQILGQELNADDEEDILAELAMIEEEEALDLDLPDVKVDPDGDIEAEVDADVDVVDEEEEEAEAEPAIEEQEQQQPAVVLA